jgi:hypothetical protein
MKRARDASPTGTPAPSRNALAMGVATTRLAGQRNFEAKGDNRWSPAARDSLWRPYGVSAPASALAIADSGNNCVLLCDIAS